MNRHGLSDQELRFFSENGYVGPFRLPYSDGQIAELRRHIYDDVLPSLSRTYPVDTCENPGTFTTGWYAARRDRHLEDVPMFELCTHPAIVDRLPGILGPNILVWRSTLFQKEPGDPVIAWHQGLNFPGHESRPSLVPAENVTAWIAIDDATSENSCVQLIPGSHKEGWQDYKPAPEGEQVFSTNMKMDYPTETATVVDIECRAGEFFLFDEMLIHGSCANLSDQRRMGVAVRYSTPAVKIYKEAFPVQLGTRALRFPKLLHPLRDLTICGEGLHLDGWGCVLVAGEDSFGHNRYAQPPSATVGVRSGIG
jgi:non-heme Fe2+,alpha-ketoglutarate-dependent halogenase